MKTYEDITFDELLAYKERLINSGVQAGMDVDEKKEINEELEKKLEQGEEKEQTSKDTYVILYERGILNASSVYCKMTDTFIKKF